MNILILGAAGFIGTNLAITLAKNQENKITLVDKNKAYFSVMNKLNLPNVVAMESPLDINEDFFMLNGQEIVYHLVSTNAPATSNQHISYDIESNVLFSSKLFDACVKYEVKKVVFVSSGGTVYGRESKCPLAESTPTNPISSYGLQKITIEKLLYLYNYMYGLNYRVVRLANPYGPYQRPDGVLGAVTTFTYKALKGEEIAVYGDGSVVRDFIYIEDAIGAMLKIVDGENEYRMFNVGCGHGTSIREVLEAVHKALGVELNVVYKKGRDVDVPVNYLDMSRYEKCFGKLKLICMEEGIKKTAEFMKRELL